MKNKKDTNNLFDEITKYFYSNCLNTKINDDIKNLILLDENKFASENLELINEILGVNTLDIKNIKTNFDESINNKFDYLKETQISQEIRPKILGEGQTQSNFSKYIFNFLIGILFPLAIFFPIYLYKKLIKNENFSYTNKKKH
jgi:uncharacterized protein YqkB